MRGKTVLVHEWVTGGGLAGSDLPASWAAEGAAMRRALAADFAGVPGLRVVMTLDQRLPAEPGPWTIVRVGPGREPDDVARVAGEADWTVLIAPETGGILADRTRILERAGGRLLGSTAEAVELTGNKLRLGPWLKARGVPTPACRRVFPSAGLPVDFPYPAVLKPLDGAGTVDTFWIEGAAALPPDAAGMTEAMLQPWVPGRAMSASVLAGPNGRVEILAGGWQRVERRGTRFVYLGGRLPIPLGSAEREVRRAIDAVAGLRGFVGVDFLWHEERQAVTILEINPRPTTSCVALARLLPSGQLARAWIDVVEGTWDARRAPGELVKIGNSGKPLSFAANGAIQPD